MLRLSTQANTEGIDEPLVLKVVTLEEVCQRGWPIEASALWLSEDFQDDAIPSVFNLPWGASIARTERGRPVGWQGSWIHHLCDSPVIAPGDVISVRPKSSHIRVLYRRGANSNVLLVTERYNSLCMMCSQPPRHEEDS